ncbi:PD-(D/E)XK nuclease family protein [Caldisericum sp.]|uniref:PD-(D/E)XK nuclease family protein n=1 Tax=Caldisericum sp. TaxID=2499687 RepID=UPI003D14C0B2
MEKYLHLLPKIVANSSKEQFGDRNYIGASDVVKCERKFLLEKRNPIEIDPQTAIKLLRGKLAEQMAEELYSAAGKQYEKQVHIKHPLKEHIRATVDLLFKGKKVVGIAEIKSVDVNNLPAPYVSWVEQINFQMGLYKLNNPQMKVMGKIVVINLNSGFTKEFEVDFNEDLFHSLLEKAERLWNKWQNGGEGKAEPSLLCSHCPYKAECPVFKGDGGKEIPEDLLFKAVEYREIKKQISQLEDQAEEIKNEIIAFTGDNFEYTDELVSLKVSRVADLYVLDSQALKKQMPDVYNQFLKPKKGYVKLVIE